MILIKHLFFVKLVYINKLKNIRSKTINIYPETRISSKQCDDTSLILYT